MPVSNCPYCGSRTHSNWLTCGEGETWGCGGALPGRKENGRDTSVTVNAGVGISTDEAFASLLDAFGHAVKPIRITSQKV